VVAALARYNPLAVPIVAVLIGGLANAGYSLQGPDFPAGLVGVLQGMILFFALGGELLLRYRFHLPFSRCEPGGCSTCGSRRNCERQRKHRRGAGASAIFYERPWCLRRSASSSRSARGCSNLGVEGMMLIGAVTAFWSVQHITGPDWMVLLLATGIGGLAALAAASIHAVLVVGLRANQIVSGLALTIFAGATGLSSYVGNVANSEASLRNTSSSLSTCSGLADLQSVGPILFHQNALVYASWALVVLALAYLYRTRTGLHVRAVGSHPKPLTSGCERGSVSLRAYADRRPARRRRRRLLQPRDHPELDRRDDLRRGLDRHRARDLRLLAA